MNDTGTCSVCGGRLRADNRTGICQRTKACEAAHRKARYDASRDTPPPCQVCGLPVLVRRPGVRWHTACRADPVVQATENAERAARRREAAEARRQAAQLERAEARLSALTVAEVETAVRRRDGLLGRQAAALAALEARRRAALEARRRAEAEQLERAETAFKAMPSAERRARAKAAEQLEQAKPKPTLGAQLEAKRQRSAEDCRKRKAKRAAQTEAERAAEVARQRERYAARRPARQDSGAAVEAARQWREQYEADRRRRGIPEDGLHAIPLMLSIFYLAN